ncbi:two-component regulator propeller domain-containing protein [Ichthyenterobacterium sp. W332]|uniref:histidine kinase n=1 Tax=Microcosmobacter mediterraneus TaxID=3075607 RepID=A0ABU2YH16_9FLAO|nr:two-component regulator propeller domain-containing protein [Ichthyenterobacterium sp. W332]MDT0557087.1 two-component regulator propeller domain-containing protein [Ichthyenterobacterium sp. W332]
MYKHLVKLCFVLLFACFEFVIAQNQKQYAFRNLTVNDGLSQNSVVSIAQDSVGYIWFATQDGLNKYQGHSFEYFNKQFQDITRATYAQLGQVYSDNYGDLWSYASKEIIERYDYNADAFDSLASIKNGTVFFRKNERELWMGTLDNGIFSIDLSTKQTRKVHQDSFNELSVFDIQYIDDSIFVGTSDGLFKIESNDIIHHFSNTTSYNISSIAQQGVDLVLGTFQNGIKIFDIQKNEYKGSFSDLPSNLNIQDVFMDSKNRLWIATYGSGLYLIQENSEVLHFKANKEDPYALHYNDILKIYEDNTGNIWFGSDGAGLSYYDEHLVKFNVLTSKQVPEDIHVDVTRAITVDSLDQVWLGTSGKGLSRLDLDSRNYKTFTPSNSNLASNRIMSLLYDQGAIWIGHQTEGLQMLTNNNKFQSFPELKDLGIWKIYKDDRGLIWLCTRTSGLLQINKRGAIINQFNTNNSGLTTNNIRTVEQGDKNSLWIGTEENGLFKLDKQNSEIEKITPVNDKIKSLRYYKNDLWIGTNGNGIKKLDVQSLVVTSYDGDYRLPNNVVYGLLPDDNGNFWVSTNKGVSRFSPEHPRKQYVEDYTLINGLQAYEFNTGAYYKAPNGTLYFGGIEGINWFNPSTITYNEVAPKTVISKFEVFNQEYNMSSYREFEHTDNTVTFTFAGLHFSHPEKNFYRYQLEGLNDNWTSPEYNNVARYTSLPPNEYTFKVLSSNYEGIWNKVPATYSFTILKPWYKTNIAYSIYLLLFLLALYTIYSYFKFKWKLETDLQLEHAETERLKQLDEFKKKLYTNISHEFRTPLTLISGPIDKQLANADLNVTERDALELVKQNANRLLGLVNQMMDLSLLDAGQLKLKVIQGNLGIILKQLVAAFQFKSEERNIKIISSIDPLKNCWFDQDIMEKINSNLLTNAIKYAPENSEIIYNVKQQETQVVISVINQNNEIKADKLGKLFERFYQKNEASDGIGVGLALVKDLVTLSKGTILANTLDENKIQFNVTLPLHQEAFEAFEKVSKHVSKIDENFKGKVTNTKEEPTILVVDDEDDILEFVSSLFKDTYQVFALNDSQKAMEIAKQSLPDLIISDIMMPEISGLELCNQLKKDPLTSHIPIILLTAKVTKDQQRDGLETGADAYVTKPFDTETLKIRVAKLIENRERLKQRFNEQPILTKALEVTTVEAEFMKRLKEVLNEYLTNPEFTSDAFSKYMLMSRTQLHRKLKAVVGMTTSEFIRSQRLLLAKDLLKKQKVNSSEVAYLVGFNSPSYFIKCFKETYNQTPSQFQSSN